MFGKKFVIFLGTMFQFVTGMPQQIDSVLLKRDTVVVQHTNPEKDDRNIMLNAANNNGPREINVGLPSSVGGTTILENDLPVVYYFWPELPSRTWRGSVSLGKTGLLNLREASISTGDFGYAVNSYTKLGGDKFELQGNLTGTHFGYIKSDLNASGPIKNNWYYNVGVFLNYDPQSFDLGFTGYADKTNIYRGGITKRFNNSKGEISLLYKYAESASLTNYAVFEYLEGGIVREIDNFRIGRDSYFLRSGKVRMLDGVTGDYYTMDYGSMNSMANKSHTVDLFGKYNLADGWFLKLSVRYHHARASANNMLPTAITQATEADGFTYMDGRPYVGYIQAVLGTQSKETPISAFQSRFDISKKTKHHNWLIGLTESHFNEGLFTFNRTFYYQEVGAQPEQLTNFNGSSTNFTKTDEYGFYGYNAGMPFHTGFENKVTAFLMDTWNLSPAWDVNYGINLRYHKMKGQFYNEPRPVGFFLNEDINLSNFDYNWFHLGGNLTATYKITPLFGVQGEFIYTEKHGALEDFSQNYTPNYTKTKSPYASFGLYYNSPKLSVVSAVTYLTRNNYQMRLNLNNPDNLTETILMPVSFDIETRGWTTDLIYKPFKGFNFHYLITIQDPIYKNYSFDAFGRNYSYDDNNVLGISKVLMEIDPSYSFGKKNEWRLWASGRYFSDQFANYTNALYFSGWWETFVGANYQMNKKLGLGLTVTNPLNQRGAKGTISGAELITDPVPYYNRLLASTYILPFTVQISANFTL